ALRGARSQGSWSGCRLRGRGRGGAGTLAPAQLQLPGRAGLVEARDRRGERRLAQQLGMLARLRRDLLHGGGEVVETVEGLGLRRLDHERLLDDQREVD